MEAKRGCFTQYDFPVSNINGCKPDPKIGALWMVALTKRTHFMNLIAGFYQYRDISPVTEVAFEP